MSACEEVVHNVLERERVKKRKRNTENCNREKEMEIRSELD